MRLVKKAEGFRKIGIQQMRQGVGDVVGNVSRVWDRDMRR